MGLFNKRQFTDEEMSSAQSKSIDKKAFNAKKKMFKAEGMSNKGAKFQAGQDQNEDVMTYEKGGKISYYKKGGMIGSAQRKSHRGGKSSGRHSGY